MTNKRIKLLLFFLFFGNILLFAQNKVAITIDDIPNTKKYQIENYRSVLLNKIDSSSIPVAIFINEGLIFKTDSVAKNFELLDNWIRNKNTTVGNHTFSHSRYSKTGLRHFKRDIEKGEYITRELTNKYDKPFKYFRFPFNDLGLDSIQHIKIDSILQSVEYESVPFTIESSDWMFNRLYAYYLEQSQENEAKKIGQLYVEITLKYFNFFDSLAYEEYGRKVSQIYLCHDNKLNTDYLFQIILSLEKKGYQFITLDEALKDNVYSQKDNYYMKWGVSWFYRWIKTQKKRIKWMKIEPDMKEVEQLFNGLD